MKIGILHPRSNTYPAIGLDFTDGLKAFLKQHDLEKDISLAFESIGFGGNEKEAYEKAEKLLMLEGVDVLVAFIDLRVKPILEPLMYATGKFILIVNPGANYPQNWVPQPNMACLSLQHAFLCWLTGTLAPKDSKGLTATTFYDCGYLHIAAMVNGFAKNGGTLTFNYVNKQPYNEQFEIRELTDFLVAHKETDQLLCIFDSRPASLLYKRLNEYQAAGHLHLLASPMMLHPNAMDIPPDGYKFSIEGYLPWQPSLPNKANQDFTGYYRRQTNRPATVFSLLGWETGIILHRVFLQWQENDNDGSAIVQQLTALELESPRGTLQLDAATNYFVAPAYKLSLRNGTAQAQTETLSSIHQQWQAFTGEKTEGPTSGWMNTYLCY